MIHTIGGLQVLFTPPDDSDLFRQEAKQIQEKFGDDLIITRIAPNFIGIYEEKFLEYCIRNPDKYFGTQYQTHEVYRMLRGHIDDPFNMPIPVPIALKQFLITSTQHKVRDPYSIIRRAFNLNIKILPPHTAPIW